MKKKLTLTLGVIAHRKAMRLIALDMAGKDVYTVMPDFGGAWAWFKRSGLHPAVGVGGNIADGHYWGTDCPISEGLLAAFDDWQSKFESAGRRRNKAYPFPLDWNDYHRRGLELTRRLKAELGEDICVVYEKPYEDPDRDTDERREVLLRGGLVALPSRRDLKILFPDKADVECRA